MTTDIMTPVGRMVQGHPMELRPQTDRLGVQKITKAGNPQVQAFVAIAIAKGGEQHWNQTEWGQQIYAAGQAGWPGGEWQAQTFAWKITDGDSQVPNKKGKLPCSYEGFPGHWVISASNGFMPDCFAHGNYGQQVMRKETYKTGDYIRLVVSVKANGSTESPGVYVNLEGCELIQAGIAIQSASFDAESTFGSVAAQLPAGAQVDPNIPAAGAAHGTAAVAQSATPGTVAAGAPPAGQAAGNAAPPPPAQTQAAAPPPPAHGFLTVNGQQYTAQQLRDGGWSEEAITAAR